MKKAVVIGAGQTGRGRTAADEALHRRQLPLEGGAAQAGSAAAAAGGAGTQRGGGRAGRRPCGAGAAGSEGLQRLHPAGGENTGIGAAQGTGGGIVRPVGAA